MYLTLITAALATLATAIPHSLRERSLEGRATCTSGEFLCHGSQRYGECGVDGSTSMIVWRPVAAGTICQCESAGSCGIVAKDAASPKVASPATAPHRTPTAITIRPIHTTSSASGRRASRVKHTHVRTSATSSSSKSITHVRSSATSLSSTTRSITHIKSSTTTSPSITHSRTKPSTTSAPSGTFGYVQYQGDGSVADGWPAQSQWLSFDDLWAGYLPNIGTNCASAFGDANNTPQETAELKTALLQQSKLAGVPAAFALALAMQESIGCVHVHTTDNGVSNPGLFQSHNGRGTCADVTPCPDSEIVQMVQDGISGTADGPGFKQLATQVGTTGAQQWYDVARWYNSGSNAPLSNLNDGDGSTSCYVMDVANRLTGWVSGNSGCTLG